MSDIEFDCFTVAQIKELIKAGKCTNEDVTHYYNNEWWDSEEDATFRYPRIQLGSISHD